MSQYSVDSHLTDTPLTRGRWYQRWDWAGALVTILTFAVFPVVSPGEWITFILPQGASVSALAVKAAALILITGLTFGLWLLRATDLRLSWALVGAFRREGFWVKGLFLLLVWIFILAFFAPVSSVALAWIGSSARMDGALIVAATLLQCVLLYRLCLQREALRAVAPTLAGIALLPSAVWIVVDALGVTGGPTGVSLRLGAARAPGAGFGHQALAASACMVWLTYTVGIALHARTWRRWLVPVAVYAAALAGAGGRAALVSALVVVPILVLLSSLRFRVRPWRLATVSIVAVTAYAGMISVSSFAQMRASTFADVIEGEDGSFNSRLVTWQIGTRLLLRSPWTGLGVGGFAREVWSEASEAEEQQLLTEFLPEDRLASAARYGNLLFFDDLGFSRTSPIIMNYDRAHNVLLDFGITYGLLALMVIVVVVGAIVLRLITSTSSLAFAIGMAGIGYAIFLQAWFFTIEVDLLVWSLLGVGLAIDQAARRKS